MPMHNPPHPGGIVRRQCLKPLGLSVTGAAKGLGVTRQALSRLVNERTDPSRRKGRLKAVGGAFAPMGGGTPHTFSSFCQAVFITRYAVACPFKQYCRTIGRNVHGLPEE